MTSTRIIGTVTPFSKLECSIDNNGNCALAGRMPFMLEAQPGTIRGYNKKFVNIMEQVRKKSLHSLDIDYDFCKIVMKELRVLGLAAYRELGDQFNEYWAKYHESTAGVNLGTVP